MLPKIRINKNLLKFKIKEDRAILMICMSIALVFWLLVKLSQVYRTQKEVHFSFVLPENRAFVSMPPSDVKAEIEGTGWDLTFEFFANPTSSLFYVLENENSVTLSRGQLRTDILQSFSSSGVKIVEVNYDNIQINLEEKVSKTVPVRLAGRFSFAPEYHLIDKINLQPDSVTVSGPASMVGLVTTWETDSLILRDIQTTITTSVRLKEPPREMELSITKVAVVIPIEQFTEKSLFVPLIIKNPPDDSIRIFPYRVKLNCVVGLSQYNLIEMDDFVMEVDLKGVSLHEGKNTVPIVLTKKPDFVKNVTFSPKSAEFFILK
jgi:hypothetical protein